MGRCANANVNGLRWAAGCLLLCALLWGQTWNRVWAAEEAAPAASDAAPLDLETLLRAEGEYPQSERCLLAHKLERTRILDESHILFELRGGRYYIAQMQQRCPGLTKGSVVSLERRSMKLCAKDGVRGIRITGGYTPYCQLPEFLPVTKEQVALLREALEIQTLKATKRHPIEDS